MTGNNTRSQTGFTVVEFIVAAGVFAIIMVTAGAIFTKVLAIQRRGLSAQKVQENAQFMIETIAKEIRVSEIPSGQDADCMTKFASSLTVMHPVEGQIRYRLLKGAVQRIAGGTTADLTSDDVEFTRFAFCIQGSDLDDKQARITILAQAKPKYGPADPGLVFDLQTTLASRNLTDELQN